MKSKHFFTNNSVQHEINKVRISRFFLVVYYYSKKKIYKYENVIKTNQIKNTYQTEHKNHFIIMESTIQLL